MIQAASDLVDLEQVIKVAEEVRRKNRGDDLESKIIEDRVSILLPESHGLGVDSIRLPESQRLGVDSITEYR